MCLTNRLHRHKEFTVFSGHKGECLPRAGCFLCCEVISRLRPCRAGLSGAYPAHMPGCPGMAAPPPAGFVRIALQQGAALVPVLTLGEADSLHNLVEWPWMQRWCTKKLG